VLDAASIAMTSIEDVNLAKAASKFNLSPQMLGPR